MLDCSRKSLPKRLSFSRVSIWFLHYSHSKNTWETPCWVHQHAQKQKWMSRCFAGHKREERQYSLEQPTLAILHYGRTETWSYTLNQRKKLEIYHVMASRTSRPPLCINVIIEEMLNLLQCGWQVNLIPSVFTSLRDLLQWYSWKKIFDFTKFTHSITILKLHLYISSCHDT